MIFENKFSFLNFFKIIFIISFLFFIYYSSLKYDLNDNKTLLYDIQKLYSLNLNYFKSDKNYKIYLEKFEKKYKEKYELLNNISQKFIYYKILEIIDFKLNQIDEIDDKKFSNKNFNNSNFFTNLNIPFKLRISKFNLFFLILFIVIYIGIIKFFEFILNKSYIFKIQLNINQDFKKEENKETFFSFYSVFFIFFIFIGFIFPLVNSYILNFLEKYLVINFVFFIFIFNTFILSYLLVLFFLIYFDFNAIISKFFRFNYNLDFIKSLIWILLFFIFAILSNLIFKQVSDNILIIYILIANFWELIFIFLALVFFIPLLEEIIFRFYLISLLENIFSNKWVIIFLAALIFSLMHFENILFLSFIFILSIYLNYIYLRYKNLYLNFWIHSFWNLLNFLVLLLS